MANDADGRTSIDDGWTIAGSKGSILMRPSSTRDRIVPSDSALTALDVLTGGVVSPGQRAAVLVTGANVDLPLLIAQIRE